MSTNDRIRQLRVKSSKLRAALEKAHLALHNSQTRGAFDIAAIHGFHHTGPVFTEDEYRFKADWGHSTFDQAVDLATEVGAKKLMFFHHDPRRTDRDLEELVDLHREQAATRGLSFEIDAAAEGDHVLCV